MLFERADWKNPWKIAGGILILCAVCLMVGKLLRMFSQENGNSPDRKEPGMLSANEQKEDEAQKEGSLFTEEQRKLIGDFDAKGKHIVLDAGHGGMDPGKIGVNGAKEKEINLQIVRKLEAYLKELGFGVTLTRVTDDALSDETDGNKKAADMRERIRIIEDANAQFAVSIHQNSFTQPQSRGAQVFFYQYSEEGKKLAEILQETLRNQLADGNHREAKPNTSYYLLKKSPIPLVIVECGFLSNPEEAKKLTTEEYQEKVAWAICLGIVEYCRQEEEHGNKGQENQSQQSM